jgi:hypothetical protein
MVLCQFASFPAIGDIVLLGLLLDTVFQLHYGLDYQRTANVGIILSTI